MPQKHEFTATIFKGGDVANASFFIEIPPEIVADFGKKGQVKVKATVDSFAYRGLLAPYGGKHLLGVRKEIRTAIGKTGGDIVNVTLEVDTEPRIVEVPDDFAQAMSANKDVRAVFDKLSFSHQKEYVEWITEAKRDETRQRRLEKAIDMLNSGQKTPRG